ncbi:hypothetical protein BA059_27410 [Mycolicibacterium sp. (ex Dasyatis americana)]|nr:hypothetical protein BA059_27410 [Mycolicibacterium sp. (ex Dasyatis americana)]
MAEPAATSPTKVVIGMASCATAGSTPTLRRQTVNVSKSIGPTLTAPRPDDRVLGQGRRLPSYEGSSDSDGGSGVPVFRVGDDESPGLEPVQRIEVPHGTHHVVFDLANRVCL